MFYRVARSLFLAVDGLLYAEQKDATAIIAAGWMILHVSVERLGASNDYSNIQAQRTDSI